MKDSVAYREVGQDYFEKRQLKRFARVFHLWALGVGAVISGDFFGWNFGLASGGFGGLFVATVIITLMYIGLCFSIAEMTAAMPHTGGAYSFARTSMGPWGGYLTGLAENMEYVLTPAVIVVGIGGYLGAIFQTPESWAPLWWLGAYAVFVGLNIWGVEISFRFSVGITLIALLILLVFYLGAIPHFDIQQALNINPDKGGSRWLPRGWEGVLGALPFAIWFYLAIEQLPLAAEESHQPQTDLPKGIITGLFTLIFCAFATLILNAGIAPGAKVIATSDEPLFEGFKTIFGGGIESRILALVAVAGLIASFHTIIYAYGRQIYSLSRAGYFPSVLSLTHARRRTPHLALIIGAVIGYVFALLIHYTGSDSPVGAALLNMAVFGAVIAYILQMLSFILLRYRFPNMERPYKSPLGVIGALFALLISLITLVALFIVEPAYRAAVVGAAIWFAAGVLWFACVGRKRLVKTPEEAFALRKARD
ncbi:MAG: ethanolamine permease [Verrucomicrobiota bacterium]|nr:ethanolamine permease [Verrucomicrobiota bacterium]